MQMHYDYFPLNFKSLPATLNFEDIRETEILYKNFKITSKILNHAMLGTVLGYKIESDGKSVVYISDHEGYKLFFPAASDKNQKIVDALERKHIDFLKNTDLIIHDAQYTSEDYSKRVGWGHSSIDYVIETALNAETKRLALIHYDPDYSDSKIDEIQDLYVNLLKEKKSDLKLIASYEGLEINLIEEKNTNE
jgi:phosphoribosyl 1,2-cyclic phosphodiesterase